MNDQSKFPADEERQIDDLFRSSLGNYEVNPSESLWKGINRKLLLKEISRFNFSNVSPRAWLAVSAIIALVTGLLLFYPGTKQPVTAEISNDIKATSNIHSGNARTVAPAEHPSGTNSQTAASSVVPVKTEQTGSSSISGHKDHPTSSMQYRVLHKPIPGGDRPIAAAGTSQAKTAKGNEELNPSENQSELTASLSHSTDWSILRMKPLWYVDFTDDRWMDTLLRFHTPNGILNVPKVKQVIPQSFSTDFGVTPEVVSYATTHNYTEMNYWLNARIGYHISRFSVHTGISLGYVFDEAKYRTNYLSKDSVGYFTDIISFYVDPQNQNQIVFNTQNVAVYDSLMHLADDRTRNRYTYVEIPLLLGYEILETNKLSLDVLFGPSVSFLVYTRKAAPYIDFPNARIVRIDDETTQRDQTNWKIDLGLHLEYRINRDLGCYLEPSYKYYFKTYNTDEESSVREPFSIGLGLGIRYHFGNLKK
jgi:hypothetical protein